ncbi:MAG: hypothetical protein JWN85_4634 [Gammaproteobacteria bacterium]|nr:hypothetical protein [Gammaproteobacteria bacterium]
MHESFINYRNHRYGVFAVALCLGAVVTSLIDSRREPQNGGTWLGYTLGSIAALLICYLALYGVRRRSFKSPAGSAAGWLSAHVYLGVAVLCIATLHCGFQFGWNVHTSAFVLMLLVSISGCWGVYVYARYPGLMIRQRGNSSRETLLEQLSTLDRRARLLVSALDERLQSYVEEAIRRTHLGGGVWAQLRGRDRSTILIPDALRGPPFARIVSNEGQHVLIQRLAQEHAGAHEASFAAKLQDLLEVASEKAVLVGKLQKDIQLQGLLQFWLYCHLPLCFGLLAALVIHVLAVFLYR